MAKATTTSYRTLGGGAVTVTESRSVIKLFSYAAWECDSCGVGVRDAHDKSGRLHVEADAHAARCRVIPEI
jgi:hypothetical protein